MWLISSGVANVDTTLTHEYRPITNWSDNWSTPILHWFTSVHDVWVCGVLQCSCKRMWMYLCVKVLETRLSLHQNTSILDGNKGENQSLCQTTLTAFLIARQSAISCLSHCLFMYSSHSLRHLSPRSPKPWCPSSELISFVPSLALQLLLHSNFGCQAVTVFRLAVKLLGFPEAFWFLFFNGCDFAPKRKLLWGFIPSRSVNPSWHENHSYICPPV